MVVSDSLRFLPEKEIAQKITLVFASLLFVFFADRTSLFLKEQKHFDPFTFLFLVTLAVIGGFCKLDVNKDTSFLNRHQTDEWKGWMQIMILIYHYTGGSSVSGIYNGMLATGSVRRAHP